MSPKSWDLGDYVDVNERLAWFFEHYPEGSMQSEIVLQSDSFLVVKAYAYRNPLDPMPGVGHASEVVPGRTPYTKDSELMVCETSAWGRALAAIGAPTKGHVASSNEVRGAESRRKSSPVKKASTEAAAPPPDIPEHDHVWEQSPTMKDWVVCTACRKAMAKEAAGV